MAQEVVRLIADAGFAGIFIASFSGFIDADVTSTTAAGFSSFIFRKMKGC